METAGRLLNCRFLSSGEPTHWPSNREFTPDVIDFFVTKNIPRDNMIAEMDLELSSDHTPIRLFVDTKTIIVDKPPGLASSKTNWGKFRKELSENLKPTPINSIEELERASDKLTEIIAQTVQNCTPPRKMIRFNPKIPPGIVGLIKAKKKARKKWVVTKFPEDKTRYNNLSSQVTSKLEEFNNGETENFLKGLSATRDTDYSLWKATKYLKKPVVRSHPIRENKLEGGWAKSSEEKAESFADHFEGVFTPNPSELEPNEEVDLTNPCVIDEKPFDPITEKEVSNMIKYKIKTKKAPGVDLITGQILKELPSVAIRNLTQIFNAVLKFRHLPENWKKAEIIVIPKAGKKPEEVESYRPISLLPIISKLFERLYLKRLMQHVTLEEIIPKHQFGFREKHSTIQQVHRLVDKIERALEDKKVVSAVFLDVAKAFDKVWHQGLLAKLRNVLPLNHCQLLENYLKDRKFRVRVDGAYSSFRTIKAGVPQGSVLGPILYVLFTYDIPTHDDTLTATFADDSAKVAVGTTLREANDKLQLALNELSKWRKKWRIGFNALKSVHIVFTYKKFSYEPVFLEGVAVPYSSTAKYLGMTLDCKLKWKEHVKKKKKELDLKMRKMYWLLGRKSKLSISNKILLYKTILRPIWSYGCQLWGCTAESNLRPIQTFQNKILRQITGAPMYTRNSDIHRDLQIDTVKQVIMSMARKHELALEMHPNSIIDDLLENETMTRRLKRRKTFELPSGRFLKG